MVYPADSFVPHRPGAAGVGCRRDGGRLHGRLAFAVCFTRVSAYHARQSTSQEKFQTHSETVKRSCFSPPPPCRPPRSTCPSLPTPVATTRIFSLQQVYPDSHTLDTLFILCSNMSSPLQRCLDWQMPAFSLRCDKPRRKSRVTRHTPSGHELHRHSFHFRSCQRRSNQQAAAKCGRNDRLFHHTAVRPPLCRPPVFSLRGLRSCSSS